MEVTDLRFDDFFTIPHLTTHGLIKRAEEVSLFSHFCSFEQAFFLAVSLFTSGLQEVKEILKEMSRFATENAASPLTASIVGADKEANEFINLLRDKAGEEKCEAYRTTLSHLNKKGIDTLVGYTAIHLIRPESMDSNLSKFAITSFPDCKIIGLEDVRVKITAHLSSKREILPYSPEIVLDICRKVNVKEEEKYSEFEICPQKTPEYMETLTPECYNVKRNIKWYAFLATEAINEDTLICVGNRHMVGPHGLLSFCASILEGSVYNSVTAFDREGTELPFDPLTASIMSAEDEIEHALVDIIGYAS